MELRKIDEADNDLLRRWRNASAEFFPPGAEIDWTRQSIWYQEYLRTPHDHQYMVCLEPPEFRPVGTLAIDIRSKMINRVIRGRPDGKGAMGAAIFELMSLYGPGTYTLQVLEGNQHAIEFYENLGFQVFGRQRHNCADRKSAMMINMLMENNL